MASRAMKKKPVRGADPVETTGAARAAGWVVLLGVWAFTTMSLIGFDPGDAPGSLVSPVNDPTLNWCGPVGAHVAYWLIEALGAGVLVMVLGGAAYLGVSVSRRSITHLGVRAIGILLLAVSAGSLQSIVLPNSGPIPGLAGGLIGDAGATALSVRFGALGASLWLLLLAAIGAIVAFDRWLILGPRWIFARSAPVAVAAGSAAGATARVGSGLVSGLTTMVRDRTPLRVRLDDLEDDRQLRREIEAKPTGSRAGRRARRKSAEPADDLKAAEPIEGENAEAYEESDD
ncbi:MAG: DNA translocase FtsK 4TM domain-containing protein, partial [Planctomycetes bacterium]|nr:DNA translocase FtsK 4TM domain-containing protein [Planctomycetota bacterium]